MMSGQPLTCAAFLVFLIELSTLGEAEINTDEEVFSASDARARAAPQTVPALILNDGYPVEVHPVRTADGYLLEMHRVPHGRASDGPGWGRPPVLLLHCFMASSAAFVQLGPSKSLAYMLADAGYDVWLSNIRGNQYSQGHERYGTEDLLYWQFSWHEAGIYDTPAMIDFILDLTNKTELDTVGFSQGATQLLVMLSQKPEYNQKVRTLTAMAPGAFMGNSNWRLLTDMPQAVTNLLFGDSSTNGYIGKGLNGMFAQMCSTSVFNIFYYFCDQILNFIGQEGSTGVDEEDYPFFFKFFPDTTSFGTYEHYKQLIKTGEFQQYDYGNASNLEVYGDADPPPYDLSKVTTNVSVFWSRADVVVDSKDIAKLVDALPSHASSHEISADENFSHLDFIWSKYAPKLVYEKLLKKLKDN